MNEPFLLSNLIELQELDNEIFKLIFEKYLLDYDKSLNEINEENSDELERINKIDQLLESLKPTLLSLSKTLQNEWRDIDLKIGKYEEEKKLLLSSFPEEIINLCDDLKSKGVEVIAAYKRENQCGCCGVDLTSNEMYEIMNSSFQQCPYCMGVVI